MSDIKKFYLPDLGEGLPDAEIVPVGTIQEMFGPEAPTVDAFVLTAERGSAYTLLHPETRLSARDIETICAATRHAEAKAPVGP